MKEEEEKRWRKKWRGQNERAGSAKTASIFKWNEQDDFQAKTDYQLRLGAAMIYDRGKDTSVCLHGLMSR